MHAWWMNEIMNEWTNEKGKKESQKIKHEIWERKKECKKIRTGERKKKEF